VLHGGADFGFDERANCLDGLFDGLVCEGLGHLSLLLLSGTAPPMGINVVHEKTTGKDFFVTHEKVPA
jgi:hypothetical protein